MHYVFGYRCPQVSLIERYEAVETLSTYGENESFRVCVQIRWREGGGASRLNLQQPTYRLGERVPVVDEVSFAKEETIPHVREVSCHLLHPSPSLEMGTSQVTSSGSCVALTL